MVITPSLWPVPDAYPLSGILNDQLIRFGSSRPLGSARRIRHITTQGRALRTRSPELDDMNASSQSAGRRGRREYSPDMCGLQLADYELSVTVCRHYLPA